MPPRSILSEGRLAPAQLFAALRSTMLGTTFVVATTLTAATQGAPGAPGDLVLDGVEFTCPIDGRTFKASLVIAYRQTGIRLDLKPLGPVEAPPPYPVCPDNGFVMYQSEFSPGEIAAIKPIVLSDAYRRARAENTDHFMIAFVKERLGAEPFDVAVTYLSASWEAERHRPQSTEHYRTLALEKFDAFLNSDAARSEDWWTASVLAAELERLLGRFEAAVGRLDQLPLMDIEAHLADKGAALIRFIDQIRLHALERNGAPELLTDMVGKRI